MASPTAPKSLAHSTPHTPRAMRQQQHQEGLCPACPGRRGISVRVTSSTVLTPSPSWACSGGRFGPTTTHPRFGSYPVKVTFDPPTSARPTEKE